MNLLSFLLTVVDTMDAWPLRPGIARGTSVWRLWQDFKLHQTATTLTKRRGDTISSCVATSNNDHILVASINKLPVLMLAIQVAARVRS